MPGSWALDPCACRSTYCPGPLVCREEQQPGQWVCKKTWVPRQEIRTVRTCKMVAERTMPCRVLQRVQGRAGLLDAEGMLHDLPDGAGATLQDGHLPALRHGADRMREA